MAKITDPDFLQDLAHEIEDALEHWGHFSLSASDLIHGEVINFAKTPLLLFSENGFSNSHILFEDGSVWRVEELTTELDSYTWTGEEYIQNTRTTFEPIEQVSEAANIKEASGLAIAPENLESAAAELTDIIVEIMEV